MSAWIVEYESINRIVDRMIREDYPKEKQKLGKKLIKMNCEAVAQRYDTPIDKKVIRAYKYQPTSVGKIQTYKTMGCFSYQCCEGNVPKTKLYKKISKEIAELADDIIGELPEYEKAIWE